MDNVTAYRAYRLRPLGLIPLIALGLLSTLATTDPGPPDLDFSGPSSLDIPIPNLRRPSVDAGPDQLVLENSVVTLSAEVINDGGGDNVHVLEPNRRPNSSVGYSRGKYRQYSLLRQLTSERN